MVLGFFLTGPSTYTLSMKLLLTSAGFQNPKIAEAFVALGGKPISAMKVALVPTAARSVEERYFVEESLRELSDIGLDQVTVFDASRPLASESELDAMDGLYMCGGNTFFILKAIRESGFDKLITKFVRRGGVYVGVSAGSIIPGPDISVAGFGSEGDPNDVNLQDLTGLQLVPFTVFPHFKPHQQEEGQAFQKTVDCPVISLTDEQAVIVTNEGYLRIG
jgi:dipeptidase E